MLTVKNAFVQSTGISQIINEIEMKKGAGHRRCPEHLVVVGPSGSGKTTLIEHLKQRFPRTVSENDERDILPLLSASFLKDVSTLAMVRHLLKQLGDPDFEERDLDTAYNKLWHLLEACQVDFICFDEFHNIRKGESLAVSPASEKFIKDLSNHSKAVLIVFGTQEAEDLIDAVDELDTRFNEYLYMPTYSVFGDQRAEFVAYLEGLSGYAEVDNPDFLYLKDLPERLYVATKANPRAIARLIDRAVVFAKRDGRSLLKHDDFYQAALRFKSSKRQAHVFRLSDKKFEKLFQSGSFNSTDWKRSFEVLKNYFSKKHNFLESYC